MSNYGYNVIERVGMGISVSADGCPQVKAGGITIAFSLITAVAADGEVRPEGETVDTNFLSNNSPADDYVYAGEKFIRYGTIMSRISGGTSAGKFVPYGTTPVGGGTLLKTPGDMYVLNRSVHDYNYSSDHDGQAMDGGLWYRNRIQVNYGTVQTLTIDATGGTFTLAYKGSAPTSAIAENAAAATVQTALEGLTTIGTGNVTVTGSAGGPYTITLSDALGVHQLLTPDFSSLTGGTASSIVAAADTTSGPTLTEFLAAFPNVRFVND